MKAPRNIEKISVIVPAFNEERRLLSTLKKIQRYLSARFDDYEVIVVDDGSRDRSVEKIKSFITDHPRFFLIQNEQNQGKGAAVRHGFKKASGDYLVFIDADLSTDINELDRLPNLLKQAADIFVSSRYLPDSQILTRQPLSRVLVSRLSNALLRLTGLSGIRDTQNGFKIFKAQVVKDILPHLKIDRWIFDIEMIYLARRFGYRVVEFPITWRASGNSSFSLARDIIRSGREFAGFLGRRLFGFYPKKPTDES